MTNDHEFRTLFRGTAESNVQANAEITRTRSDLIPTTRLQLAHCEQMLEKTTMQSLSAVVKTIQRTVQNSHLNK